MSDLVPDPTASSQPGHVHDYALDDTCMVTGCERTRPVWLDVCDPDADPEPVTGSGPDWGQRIALVVLSLVVSFAGLHYVGAYVTKATEKPSTSSGYLDLPPEVGTVTPRR